MDITGDSFYSSQGRIDSNFDDKNEILLDKLAELYPKAGSLQMETFQLFHLAKICKKPIHAGAVAIVLAQRQTNQFLDNETKHLLEKAAGQACLDVLKNCTV